jgi:hypothetical protein
MKLTVIIPLGPLSFDADERYQLMDISEIAARNFVSWLSHLELLNRSILMHFTRAKIGEKLGSMRQDIALGYQLECAPVARGKRPIGAL